MRGLVAASLLSVASPLVLEGVVHGQLRPLHTAPSAPSPRPAGPVSLRNLRSRLSAEVASRLMRSADPDDRVRGIERATTVRTREGLALLVRAATSAGPGDLDPRLPAEGIARTDPRALLAVVRGLATWSNEDSARLALASVVRDSLPRETSVGGGVAPTPGRFPATEPFKASASADRPAESSSDEADGAARVLLARQIAALALAGSGSSLAADALVAIARTNGPGQQPALDALAVLPPSNANLLGATALTTPAMVALATTGGDLRTIDAIDALTHSTDPALRAASIAAIGVTDDVRDAGLARAALADPDPRVRVAAADALVRLSTPDSAGAVETLINDDATVLDGLDLAQFVQSDAVTRAAAARAVAASDSAVHAAALAALGRQTAPSAVRALESFALDPSRGGDAACALAHSPSAAALAAIESLGRQPTARRLAARAYFVRRYTRGERSGPLEALLRELSVSKDPLDRTVGLQARVSLGEATLPEALGDPSASVRRAVAMTAIATWSDRVRAALLARRSVETDAVTQTVLGIGLLDADPLGMIANTTLVRLARNGAGDAPLAVMTLAARATESATPSIDAFLDSTDPVIRAHAASGLARSAAPDAVGKLIQMYTWEVSASVRRAIVAGLGTRDDRIEPLSRDTLKIATRLDPDRVVRWIAARALADRPLGLGSARREVAWIQLIAERDATLPHDETAMLVQSDGSAIPIAFDAEGYALVPGVRSGQSRLRLAPRLPAYSLFAP